MRHQREFKVLRNRLQVKDMNANDMMTPRIVVITCTQPALLKDIVAVQESDSINTVFEKMLEDGEDIVLLRVRFVGLEGIVTLEDIIEIRLVSEIVDEHDSDFTLQKLARRGWNEWMQRQGINDAAFNTTAESNDG